MLLDQIETREMPPRRVVFAPQLVVRGSTGGAPGDQVGGRKLGRGATE
jgi:hypothetical protein